MYFNPSDTFNKAIQNKDVGALRALLVGIIGSDPTFVTGEYDEAREYIKAKSDEIHGELLQIEEPYKKQEDEYEKEDDWDEDFFQMQLLWLRYNFAPKERLDLIKKIGYAVYENKPTLGKSKRKSVGEQKTEPLKKGKVAIATGGDNKKIRLFSKAWFAKNCWWIVPLAIGVIVVICCMVFM